MCTIWKSFYRESMSQNCSHEAPFRYLNVQSLTTSFSLVLTFSNDKTILQQINVESYPNIQHPALGFEITTTQFIKT